MAYYLIFDEDDKFKGYTDRKDVVKEFLDQRKKFSTFRVEKVKESFFQGEAKVQFRRSDTELFDYYGIYLFPEEETVIHEACYSAYSNIYTALKDLGEWITAIKLTEEEEKIIRPFLHEMYLIMETIQDEYYTSEDPYYECFKVDNLTLKFLKQIAKGKEPHFDVFSFQWKPNYRTYKE